MRRLGWLSPSVSFNTLTDNESALNRRQKGRIISGTAVHIKNSFFFMVEAHESMTAEHPHSEGFPASLNMKTVAQEMRAHKGFRYDSGVPTAHSLGMSGKLPPHCGTTSDNLMVVGNAPVSKCGCMPIAHNNEQTRTVSSYPVLQSIPRKDRGLPMVFHTLA